MTRFSLLAAGLILLSSSVVAIEWPETLSPAELTASYGGDPTMGVSSVDCDAYIGALTECQDAGDICQYCMVQSQFGPVEAEADILDPNGFKGNNNTGWTEGNQSQNCGTIYNGVCIASGKTLVCKTMDTKSLCTNAINSVVAQGPPLPTKPGNPGD